MKTTLAILSDLSLPVSFRLFLADLAVAGLKLTRPAMVGAARGWNAATLAAGGAGLVELSLPTRGAVVPIVDSVWFVSAHGCQIRDEAKVLHPQWREAIQRGEQIQQHEGEVLATHSVSERFVPFKYEVPAVADHPGGVHPPEDEVHVVAGGGHAPDHAPAAPPAQPFSIAALEARIADLEADARTARLHDAPETAARLAGIAFGIREALAALSTSDH